MNTPASASFHRRAEEAVADARLRGAVDTATARMLANRAAALALLPDADAARDRARAIRAGTLARLDEHLSRFIESAQAAGATVYWADTAADACARVVDLARVHGATRAVKSKSMVSEEVRLNAALLAAGIDVVETDLGEFVVQVAGDEPSHIIAPIIHKTRHQVGDLFRERLGATADDVADIPALTAFARRMLRARFLEADLGISGVNMAVASTGTLCIVTNEGNGRLTTSLPRVHIALMGIERLVPTPADLAVILDVLGRSATGQPLTVYTNLITGPRRAGDSDGPEHLYVVLVDNGRTRLLASEQAEILLCIRCGACLNVCPVYRQVGGHAYRSVYPGPVGSVLTPALTGFAAGRDLPHASSLCGACRDVCPVRIDIPRLLLSLRASEPVQRDAPLWLRAGLRGFRMLAVRPRLFRAAQWLGARVLPGHGAWVSRLPGPLAAWTVSRDFPRPARRPFSSRAGGARDANAGGLR